MPYIKFIAAIDDKNGIAIGQKLPWDLPSDRKYFRDKLKKGPVASGWNTFAANNFKPYGEGKNIVFTRDNRESAPGVWIAHDCGSFFWDIGTAYYVQAWQGPSSIGNYFYHHRDRRLRLSSILGPGYRYTRLA